VIGSGTVLAYRGRSEDCMHEHPDWPKTLDEFRAWHERQPEVWEFIDGVPKLMAPGSMAHTLVKSNTHAALAQALLVDGAIVEAEGASLIPDVVVTCSELDFTTRESLIRSSSRCLPPRTRRTMSAASSRSTSRSRRCATTS
jgi:hypothetical protein